eukprot:5402011-Pyramimonas_sp.AAC.1
MEAAQLAPIAPAHSGSKVRTRCRARKMTPCLARELSHIAGRLEADASNSRPWEGPSAQISRSPH